MKLPADDYMLLSLVNTALRDNFKSLADLCEDWNIEESELSARLAVIGYIYDKDRNAFTV